MKVQSLDDGSKRFIHRVDVDVIVEEIDVMTNIECGFRVEAFTGTAKSSDGEEFDVSCSSGGGCGNTWVMIDIGDRHFRMDMMTIAHNLSSIVINEYETAKKKGAKKKAAKKKGANKKATKKKVAKKKVSKKKDADS